MVHPSTPQYSFRCTKPWWLTYVLSVQGVVRMQMRNEDGLDDLKRIDMVTAGCRSGPSHYARPAIDKISTPIHHDRDRWTRAIWIGVRCAGGA